MNGVHVCYSFFLDVNMPKKSGASLWWYATEARRQADIEIAKQNEQQKHRKVVVHFFSERPHPTDPKQKWTKVLVCKAQSGLL